MKKKGVYGLMGDTVEAFYSTIFSLGLMGETVKVTF
jgi:hypothetical protein